MRGPKAIEANGGDVWRWEVFKPALQVALMKFKNIIGDRVLGLPREPSVDKGVPFKDLMVGTQKGS